MTSNLDRFRKDLESLIELGEKMNADILCQAADERKQLTADQRKTYETFRGAFLSNYQAWYTTGISVVRQLIPDRSAEFIELYKSDAKSKAKDIISFSIQDWMMGFRANMNTKSGERIFNDISTVINKSSTQLDILRSAKTRLESSLFDIKHLVQADLLDSEIEAAKELAKKGFLRAAGAIAGVLLEKHLAEVSLSHKAKPSKKKPTIADYNESLKAAGVIDIPVWRNNQRLADLRNLCDHHGREPAKDEIEELINGVEKVSKTLF